MHTEHESTQVWRGRGVPTPDTSAATSMPRVHAAVVTSRDAPHGGASAGPIADWQSPIPRSPAPLPPTAGQGSEILDDLAAQTLSALVDQMEVSELASLEIEAARQEIRDAAYDVIALRSIVMPIAEEEGLLDDI